MSEDSNPDSPSMLNPPPRSGKKRRRESDPQYDADNNERPAIRIKCEKDLCEDDQNGDEFGPPTPPMPRSNQEEGNHVNEEILAPRSPVVGSADQGNHSAEIRDSERPGPSVVVKREPGESNSNHTNRNGGDTGAEEEDSGPTVSSFFSFAGAPQPDATVPNAMNAEIKHKPVPRPMRPGYLSYQTEEDDFNYGDNDGKIKTIPYPTIAEENDDDSDSDGQGDDPKESAIEDSRRVSRYFKNNAVFSKYDFKSRKVDATRLGVHEKKVHILNSLEKKRVVIIEGFTGCGKTTQVPQYILDKCFEEQKYCNIVVTQPRKIAAISVARRVCYERNWNLGSVVGYQVGMESKTDRKDTLLTFMTTGVLLQKLISMRSLKEYTHIIIDEVHERDLESDFLLLVIKRIMAADTEGKERHVKLVLMSATIDTKKFENYFVFEKNGEEIRPHTVKIPFVARHRIQEFYLDDILETKRDLLQQIESNMDKEKAMVQEEIYEVCVSCIASMDDLERDNNPDPRMRRTRSLPKLRGAVLVFLPGMEEIKRLQRALDKAQKEKVDDPNNESRDSNYYRWAVLPLHSSVTADEQARVFDPPGDTFRKIILSTNIAESSVTVPDISYVIDFCLTKSLCIDDQTNFTTLRMSWAAESQCIQRKGRSGRVSDGRVYRLVPKSFFSKFDKSIKPEMQRSNLETVILMCKKFDLDSPMNLLKDALDRPRKSGIERAVSTLKELGALTVEMMVDRNTQRTVFDDKNGDLTFVGRVMTDLPIPQQCSRLILLGHAFGVMHEAIIVAAGLSVKNPFQTGFQKQLDTYLEKMKHAKKTFSDLFALYHVYQFWIRNYSESGDIKGGRKTTNEYRWAKGAMVHLPVLREIKSTVELLEERLKRLGITASYTLPTANDANSNPNNIELGSEQGMFLKLAIAGAFYPNYFLRRRPDSRQYEREVNKEVNGNDCFRTVYFKGFPVGHEGKLYAKHVANYLSHGLSIPAVKFDGQKVLGIFDNSTGDTIGPFSAGFYRAIKLRQLRTEPLEFKVLWREEERREMYRWEAKKQERPGVNCPDLRSLPPIDTHDVKVRVQHINNPSQFWVVLEQDHRTVENLTRFIQENLTPIPFPRNKIFPNALCLAPYDGLYYRAKILRSEPHFSPNSKSLVYFIDYGNTDFIPSSTLYDFSPFLVEKGVTRAPCMAIECRLKELKPNIIHGQHWTKESIEYMKRFCSKAPNLVFEIYSIHQSVMSGELVGYNDQGAQRCSLNDCFLSSNNTAGKLLGEPAPEPYLSMENWRKRQRIAYMDREEKNAAGYEQVGDSLDLDFMDPPNGKTPVTLKGPWSPLEMTFQACVKCSNTKEVRVENSSVNSVALDHEPTSSNSRMLVAAHVSVTQKSEACMIRDSTMMAAIPGILSLVSMMFAPRAELRVDRNLSKYTGIVCGLGTVPDIHARPPARITVHPDNDMEVVFDTEIDDEDIDRINIIRYNLNLILRNSRGVNKAEYHKRLRDEVIRLLLRKRKRIEEEIWPQEEYVWDRLSNEFLQTAVALGMSFNHDDIFQPHKKVMLNRMEVDEVRWDGGY